MKRTGTETFMKIKDKAQGLFLNRKSIVIDGKKIKVREGITILQAAQENGIDIPTMCHVKDVRPTGVCRVCVVEVEGARTLVGACHTLITDKMVIHTRSPKVLAVRKSIIELMLASHTGNCVNDPNAENCRLHNLASDHEVGAPRFQVRKQRLYPVEDQNPYILRNMSKCILCRRCVVACKDIAGKDVLSVGYRGFNTKITVGFDESLNREECKNCGICVEQCPTGALSKPLDIIKGNGGIAS